MPQTQVNIYQDAGGRVPLLEWLDSQPQKIVDKFTQRFDLLAQYGYNARRPMFDFLRDGIYEIRIRGGHVNYRVLYGFVGQNVVLLSHGCTKKDKVPGGEIVQAIENLNKYKLSPKLHTYKGYDNET